MENLKIIESGNAIILRFSGKLDFTNADDLEREIQSLIGTRKLNLIFNLSEVTFISSSGIRVLMVSMKIAAGYNLKVLFVAVNEKAKHLLEILGLLDQIKILETEEEALSFLK